MNKRHIVTLAISFPLQPSSRTVFSGTHSKQKHVLICLSGTTIYAAATYVEPRHQLDIV